MARKGLAACAMALVLAPGCGTFNNVTGHDGPGLLRTGTRIPYGGVKLDYGSFEEAFAPNPARQGAGILLVPYFMFIDAPLSLLGDTLTLPYVLCRQAGEQTDAGPVTPWDEFWRTNQTQSLVKELPPDKAVAPTTASSPAAP